MRSHNLEHQIQELQTQVKEQDERVLLPDDQVYLLYQIIQETYKSFDLDPVLNRTLIRISQALQADRGSILLLDPDSGYLEHRAAVARAHTLPKGGKRTRFRRGVGLAGWVIEHNEPALLPSIDDDPRWEPDPGGPHDSQSALALPLASEREVLGVMLLFHDERGYFQEKHLTFAEAAAKHIVTAIENTEMFRLVREQAYRLGTMLRRQRHINAQNYAILSAIADGVAVSDEDGQIAVINDAARRILRLGAVELDGLPLSTLFAALPEAEQEVVSEALARVRAHPRRREQLIPLAVTVHREDQIIQAAFMPMFDERRIYAGIVIVFRDITREREIAQAKNEFVSVVAHELRTPMTSIKGYTDLILQGALGEVNDEQRHFLRIVKANVDRLSELIGDLLDTARIEAGRIRLEIEPIQVTSIVGEVCDSLAETIRERGLELTVEADPDVPTVQADRNRLIQILMNLLSNAYRYTPSGGSITVSVRLTDDAVLVAVADSGIGIAPEDQERIFERFHRVDNEIVNRQTGTGLGLTIARSLVELHGGRLWLESEFGVGSTFFFTLPIQHVDVQPV
ncbi:MAG: ATP-binding protein [Anaerolineae bacterium]